MNKDFTGLFRLKVRKSTSTSSTKKRSKSNSIFTPMSVAHVDDEDGAGTNNGVYASEKVFSNGDFYGGQWGVDDLPHGHGKFIWNDGCMYVGEWQNGKTMGNGRFIWSSGATYEGEFKDGFMNGKGTYIGSNGDTYRGFWSMNLKNGQGTKNYANGDFYEGDWKNDLQDGHGRYQWVNGHSYVGEWANGSFHGKGTLIWANGNKYEGDWVDGIPKGEGTFSFANGGSFVGVWNKDSSEKNVTYYPIEGLEEPENWDPRDLYLVELNECKVSPGEMITMYPSHKIEKLKGEINVGKTPSSRLKNSGRKSIDVRLVNGAGCPNGKRNSVEGFENLRINNNGQTPRRNFHPILLPKTIRKQGETICKGHKNYDLMLNLQLGIRHSVGRPGPVVTLDLKSSAFDPREKVWTRFPAEGSKHTPPHSSCEFKWKDYCPLVFRTLRKLFKVDAADYMISICGNDALRELSSPGKSGSFFYLTHDDKYMIKTMKKAEVKVLLRMLPAYYNHVRTHEATLVTRFFGLHCVKLTGAQKKVRFVIMGNLFCTDYAIHRRFDLKGSSHGRTTDKPESEIDPTTTLKDLDLNYIFRLERFWFQEFCRQVDRDCDFLEQERIMDYSLLVGLHFKDSCTKPLTEVNGNADSDMLAPRLSRVDETDKLVFDAAQWESIRLGINMPARAEVTIGRTDCDVQLVGKPTGECYDVIVFFGIIDILQDYDISKKLEHAYKSFQYDPSSISAVDPKQYSKRFRDFIYKAFREDS